jgi:hypothetical protein
VVNRGDGRSDPVPQVVRWEYREVTIPLRATSKFASHDLQEHYDQRVHEHLERARQEGWQCADPTDWMWAWRTRHLRGRLSRGFLGLGEPRYVYESVTVRLKRPSPEQPTVPRSE